MTEPEHIPKFSRKLSNMLIEEVRRAEARAKAEAQKSQSDQGASDIAEKNVTEKDSTCKIDTVDSVSKDHHQRVSGLEDSVPVDQDS